MCSKGVRKGVRKGVGEGVRKGVRIYNIIYIYIYMAPQWHQGTIAPRALKKNKNKMWGKWPKANHCF